MHRATEIARPSPESIPAEVFIVPGRSVALCIKLFWCRPSRSSTSVDHNQPFNVSFGDGSSVYGIEMADVVGIADLTVRRAPRWNWSIHSSVYVQATSQALGIATRYSVGFSSSEFSPDGLLGMAFPQISALDAAPLFQTLVVENQTAEPVFSFKLASSGSQLTLGGVDEDQFQGPMTQVPVTTVVRDVP